MGHPRLALALGGLLLAGLAASLATAAPPRPGTDDNGLNETEAATLWTRDDDTGYISNAAYREAYGENRSAVHEVANGTDLTFKRPPETAPIWTRHDHRDFQPGDRSASVYPPHANRTNASLIADAHATVFAVTPRTTTHVSPNETRDYVAPEGTVRGTVDYRVRMPPDRIESNRSITWTVLDHEISEVRLLQDGRVIARANGSHRPALAYAIAGRETTLTLEADIEVRLARTVAGSEIGNRTQRPAVSAGPGRNTSRAVPSNASTDVTVVADAVTVSDDIDVTVYDLTAVVHHAEYPDGDHGVAIFQSRPWQGYTLTATDSARVRGIWRFYTARNTDWDVLHRTTANGTTELTSPALPVAVHAYPSRLGPRAEPVGGGPEIIEVWGEPTEPPTGSLGPTVLVEVVTDPYTPSHGVAVRAPTIDREAVTVHGIVRGETAQLGEPVNGTERAIRESELSAEIVSRNDTGVTVALELRDGSTGEPIVLEETDERGFAIVPRSNRTGFVTLAGQRVETNGSGRATVFIDDAGVYTARYHPGTWLAHDPAYVADAATVRWHPLTTIDGWVALGSQALVWFLPFALALYAGRTLGSMLAWRES